MKNKKLVSILLVLGFLIPQITFAAWWNPFTWKVFQKGDNNTKILEERILELEKRLASTTTETPVQSAQVVVSTSTPTTSIQVYPKVGEVQIPKTVKKPAVSVPKQDPLPVKDYEKIYKDLRVGYSELRYGINDEIVLWRDTTLRLDAERNHWNFINKLSKEVNEDITYLATIEKSVPKPGSILDSYVIKLNEYKEKFDQGKLDFATRKDQEIENQKKDELKKSVVTYIRDNRLNLHKDTYHVTAAFLLDNYDREFGTDYYSDFQKAKTQVDTVEFSNHFLLDLGENL